MTTIKKCFGLVTGCLVGLGFYACSAKSDNGSNTGLFPSGNAGFGAGGPGFDSSLGGGSGFENAGGSSGALIIPTAGNAGALPGHDGGCPAIRQKPETIVVYKDASVTDTIYTSKPVALFIMQDRSGSMKTGFPPPACSCSWDDSTAAVTAFVNDPQTAGIDIGLGTFPVGPNNTADCKGGTDCGTPVVPIAPLPGNAQPMIQAYQAQTPQNPIADTPTECGLNGMINTCLQFMAQSKTGEQCVGILVTDGTPFNVANNCDTNQANLVNIVAQGHSKGVTTYALGLQGADTNFMNQIAQAGGTGTAIDVSGGAQKFIDALNGIRQKVAVTTTTQVTTSTTISSPLPCEWGIPPVQPPATFDPTKVNVEFTPPGGAPIQFGNIPNAAACAATTQNAWYYEKDAMGNPTKVVVCPNTCNTTLKNSAGAEVDVVFGCDTVMIPIH